MLVDSLQDSDLDTNLSDVSAEESDYEPANSDCIIMHIMKELSRLQLMITERAVTSMILIYGQTL